MKRALSVAALFALSTIGTPAAAEDHRAEASQEQLQQTIERLELTEEQTGQVEPLLRELAKAQQDILAKYGLDRGSRQESDERPGRREIRAMRREMDAVREDTLDELGQILSDEQIEEFERIQDERRAEMRERMRGSR